MYIAILEDNAERREAMTQRLAERLFTYEQVYFTTSAAMNNWLEQHLHEVIAISLDHDLDIITDDQGQRVDAGTGRDVADYLCTAEPVCPIVIHSTNVAAAMGMEAALLATGWQVDRITPYEDLLWVTELWLPTFRNAIVRYEPETAGQGSSNQQTTA